MPSGALLNIAVPNITEKNKLVPINNQYKFVAKFYITGTDTLSGSSNFPQNQEIVFNNLTTPLNMDVQLGYGNYTINNITLKIFYGDLIVLTHDLNNITISCIANCTVTPTPVNVNTITSTQYEIIHQSGNAQSLKWEVRRSGFLITEGTVNNLVNSSPFVITTPALVTQQHSITLIGITCVGQASLNFTPVSSDFVPETQGNYEATAILT